MQGYEVVRSADRLGHIANEIESATEVSLDLETVGFRPRAGKIRLCSINTGRGVYVIDMFETKTLGPVASALQTTKAVKIGQNLKFDQKWLLHNHGLELPRVFDTFRASNLIHAGRKMGHNLYDLYKRELGQEPGTQDLGGSDWNGPLTQEQLDYAADDVFWLPKLREKLKPQLAKFGLNTVALIEFEAILPEAALENSGFRLDSEMWLELAAKNTKTAILMAEELRHELPHPSGQLGLPGMVPSFNLGSTQQLQASLARLGLEVTSTNEDTLAMNAGKFPVLTKLIGYKKVQKLVDSFGPEFLSFIDAETGRIHAGFYPFTGTGRYSCSAPWTPVRTEGGMKPLAHVVPGDLVWTHRGRWRRVLAFLPQGRRQVFDVRFSNGHVLTCTADHRVLLSDGRWITIEELRHEYFQDLGSEPQQSGEGSGAVSEVGAASDGGRRAGAGNDVPQCSACDSDPHSGAREEGAGSAAVLSVEERYQESNVREEGEGAPQLEGGVRGRVRLSDLSLERREALCSSSFDDGGARRHVAVKGSGSAPHRFRSEEQLPRQLGVDDARRAQSPSLHVGEGQPLCTVEEIHPSGSLEVYDLTVEEDESFETCGVFSHNCSKPNLQQIPRGKEFRACFRPGLGRKLVVSDYSQIELRIAAEISGDATMIAAYNRGEDIHRLTAALVNDIPLDQVTKNMRQMAKAINFGLIYGLGEDKLVIYAQTAYQVTMTQAQARSFRKRYFEGYAGISAWHRRVFNEDKRRQITHTIGGRLRWLEDGKAHNEFANCVDMETEALTRRGWVKGFDLQRADVLLTKNPATGALEWQEMTDLRLFPDYEGPLVEFRSRSFHAVSTPDHRWLVKDKTTGSDVERTTRTLSVWGDHRIHRTGSYSAPDKSGLSPDEAELLGWFVTDGFFRTGQKRKGKVYPFRTAQAFLTQSASGNGPKCERIDALLARLGGVTGRYVRSYDSGEGAQVVWNLGKRLSGMLLGRAPARTLEIRSLLDLGSDALTRLREAMILGDGTVDRMTGKVVLATGRREQAEAFQILCTLTGSAASVVWRDMSQYTPSSSKLMNTPKGAGIWLVTILKRTTVQVLKKQRREVRVQAPVWCPIVPNSFFVARRSGHVFVTGNTPVQGTGADGLKAALRRVYDRLKKYNGDAFIAHMVHDEIVVDSKDDPDLLESVKKDLEEGMKEGVAPFLKKVPVEVEGGIGDSWADK